MKKEIKTGNIILDFAVFTKAVSDAVGNFWSFLVGLILVLIWLITGPFFHYSETWQLVINTGTTIVTFLMVFIIQHTQNRDTEILNLKLDELIKAHKGAQNARIDLDKLTDAQLHQLKEAYEKICHKKQ